MKELYLAQNNLRYLSIIITTKSNCHCAFCNISRFTQEIISKETIDKIFDNAKVDFIEIRGGEVLLYPDICIYISKKCKEKGIKLNLISSCLEENSSNIINNINPDILTVEFNCFHKSKKDFIENVISNINKSIIIEEEYFFNHKENINNIEKLNGVDTINLRKRTLDYRDDENCPCICRGFIIFPSEKIVPFCQKMEECLSSSKIEDFDKILKELEEKKYFVDFNRSEFC
jgi:hypothetical protein